MHPFRVGEVMICLYSLEEYEADLDGRASHIYLTGERTDFVCAAKFIVDDEEVSASDAVGYGVSFPGRKPSWFPSNGYYLLREWPEQILVESDMLQASSSLTTAIERYEAWIGTRLRREQFDPLSYYSQGLARQWRMDAAKEVVRITQQQVLAARRANRRRRNARSPEHTGGGTSER